MSTERDERDYDRHTHHGYNSAGGSPLASQDGLRAYAKRDAEVRAIRIAGSMERIKQSMEGATACILEAMRERATIAAIETGTPITYIEERALELDGAANTIACILATELRKSVIEAVLPSGKICNHEDALEWARRMPGDQNAILAVDETMSTPSAPREPTDSDANVLDAPVDGRN